MNFIPVLVPPRARFPPCPPCTTRSAWQEYAVGCCPRTVCKTFYDGKMFVRGLLNMSCIAVVQVFVCVVCLFAIPLFSLRIFMSSHLYNLPPRHNNICTHLLTALQEQVFIYAPRYQLRLSHTSPRMAAAPSNGCQDERVSVEGGVKGVYEQRERCSKNILCGLAAFFPLSLPLFTSGTTPVFTLMLGTEKAEVSGMEVEVKTYQYLKGLRKMHTY